MRARRLVLAPSLLLIAAMPALRAQDTLAGAPIENQPGPSPSGGTASGTGLPELSPGARYATNAPRQVVVRGLIDLDALIQGNYLDGNNDVSDHRGYGLLRAELGTKVKLDERVATVITIAYYNEAGTTPATPTSAATTTTPTPTVRTDRGPVVFDDAYVELKEFLGFQELGVDAGRMPFCWSLKDNAKDAFLYDSRANDPAVTSWDGARATYNFDTIDITPYAFRLPDLSSLFGAGLDWKPPRSGSTRTFITGSINLERNVVLRPTAATPTERIGRRLITYYAGAEFELGEFDISGEYAAQRGQESGSTRFYGWGADAAIEWRTPLPSGQQFALGIKGDYLSGDSDPTDDRDYAFINNWEGVTDTYIVESEKYGELSRYVQGNLEDIKGTAGIAFDDHNRIRLSATYGYYRMPSPTPGVSRNFGQEGDLTLTWQYTYNATFSLFGGAFKPFAGFDSVAPGPGPTSTDPVYLMGLNLKVLF
jgi:hypothetical protein